MKLLSERIILALILVLSSACTYMSQINTSKASKDEISEDYNETIAFQKELTDTYSNKETSILSSEDIEKFIALGGHPFYPVNPKFVVNADLIVFDEPDRIAMKTSTSRIANYNLYGKASFTINKQEFELLIYQDASTLASKLYKDHLFVPFTDLTSGEETYGGGRYLDLIIPEDNTKIKIDFNKTYHPYCAYTDGYSCPIPPVENFINYKIEAGIKHLDIKHAFNADELLTKSIAYHDPKNNWEQFNATFDFKTIMADQSERKRKVKINNKKSEFYFESQYDEGLLEYMVTHNVGAAKWNGNEIIPEDMAKKYRISNDRAVMYRNYYSYLYGMPMKLRDPGTHMDSFSQRVTFYNKTYDRIKVSYDQEVGSDTWYFYFNTDTHALEAYQFFKDESKNDGEYILFEETKLIDNIKIPSIRHWYYNKDQKFLATDILE